MIFGYDLDGVLLPDLNLDGLEQDEINKILALRRDHLKPIFIPDGRYYVITGRPYIDKEDTFCWMKKYLKSNPPIDIIFNPDSTPETSGLNTAMFKSKTIYEKHIDVFIESDQIQAKHIQTLLLIHYDNSIDAPKVLCFSEHLKYIS